MAFTPGLLQHPKERAPQGNHQSSHFKVIFSVPVRDIPSTHQLETTHHFLTNSLMRGPPRTNEKDVKSTSHTQTCDHHCDESGGVCCFEVRKDDASLLSMAIMSQEPGLNFALTRGPKRFPHQETVSVCEFDKTLARHMRRHILTLG